MTRIIPHTPLNQLLRDSDGCLEFQVFSLDTLFAWGAAVLAGDGVAADLLDCVVAATDEFQSGVRPCLLCRAKVALGVRYRDAVRRRSAVTARRARLRGRCAARTGLGNRWRMGRPRRAAHSRALIDMGKHVLPKVRPGRVRYRASRVPAS
jgi:hypothetical protein